VKILKIIISFLAVVIVLSFLPACGSEEPEKIAEPSVEETAATKPEIEEETEEAEEAEEAAVDEVDEEPELIWVFEHEDLDFKLESIAVSPDGETLVVGSYLTTYTHILYDGTIIDAITSHRHSVEDIDFSPDGSIMGVGLGLYGSVLIDTEDGSELFQLHDGYNNRLAFSPDGEYVATGNRDGIIWIWDVESGGQVAELDAPDSEYIQAIDFHPSGKLLAVTHFDCTVNIWDTEEKKITNTIQLDVGEGSCGLSSNTFRFSPDSEVMAGAIKEDGEKIVRLWTVDDFQQFKDFAAPERIRDLAFSPDGKLLAIASRLATTVWDVQTGELLYTFDQIFDSLASDSPVALSFTIDGGYVAEARNDGTLELWRLPGAEPLEEPEIDMKEPPPIPGDVLFDTGSSELKAGADEVLEEYALGLHAALKEAKITFIGHTDSRGDAASNMQLSLDRAAAIKDWFENWAANNGADGWELFVDGKGDTELKVPDVDAEGNFREEAGRLNRRVEIEIGD